MAEQVDARGLSCPQPVIMTHNKMKELKKGIFEVMVDTDTSRENISRLARNEGWEVVESKKTQDSGYIITLKKE
ncbi:MAG: sulfurtransferase TusA family protein [Thermodesulfovibrionales bacterium]|nr:sulfurtransferase TusA family protein [Thermodesulfovibrionales bacterium]